MTDPLALTVDAVRLLSPPDLVFPSEPHEVEVVYRVDRGGAIWLSSVRMVPLEADA